MNKPLLLISSIFCLFLYVSLATAFPEDEFSRDYRIKRINFNDQAQRDLGCGMPPHVNLEISAEECAKPSPYGILIQKMLLYPTNSKRVYLCSLFRSKEALTFVYDLLPAYSPGKSLHGPKENQTALQKIFYQTRRFFKGTKKLFSSCFSCRNTNADWEEESSMDSVNPDWLE